jgi:hypothetical protein
MTTATQTIPAGKPPSLGQLLIGIIDQPLTTFKAVKARRGWLTWAMPLLILLLAFAGATAAQIPYIAEMARQQAETQLASLPEDQADSARAGMAFSLSLPFLVATSLGFGGLALCSGLAAQAAFFYFAASIASSEDVGFGPIFSMSAWARLPMALGFLVQGVFVAVSQHTIQYPGLAFLVASGEIMQDARNPFFAVLSGIDLFWLWHLLLLVLGLSVTARLGRGASLVLVLLYAVLTLAVTAAPTLIFGAAGFAGG